MQCNHSNVRDLASTFTKSVKLTMVINIHSGFISGRTELQTQLLFW